MPSSQALYLTSSDYPKPLVSAGCGFFDGKASQCWSLDFWDCGEGSDLYSYTPHHSGTPGASENGPGKLPLPGPINKGP